MVGQAWRRCQHRRCQACPPSVMFLSHGDRPTSSREWMSRVVRDATSPYPALARMSGPNGNKKSRSCSYLFFILPLDHGTPAPSLARWSTLSPFASTKCGPGTCRDLSRSPVVTDHIQGSPLLDIISFAFASLRRVRLQSCESATCFPLARFLVVVSPSLYWSSAHLNQRSSWSSIIIPQVCLSVLWLMSFPAWAK